MTEVFKMPNPTTIMGRSSSITNAFINGIVPCISPSDEEIDNALKVLGMDRESISCAYCGDPHTEWDHLNPLIVDKGPTGFISEISNLVPACSKCNQSKGNKHWKDWFFGNAKLSPKSRGIKDLEHRASRLEAYERAFIPTKIAFEDLVGKKTWDDYWNEYGSVIEAMSHAQDASNRIKQSILEKLELKISEDLVIKTKTTTNRRKSDPLPIFLIPPNQKQFEEELIKSKSALIETHYQNGKIEIKVWKARRFSKSSDVYNNLRTRAEFRPGTWRENGIDHVVVRIENNKTN